MGKIGKKLTKLLSKKQDKAKPMYDFRSQGPPPGTVTEEEAAEKRQVHTIPIDSVKPNATQPRDVFNDEKLGELAASIKAKGVLQPIIYRQTAKGAEIIAGERRWRASRLAGLNEIPAIERNVSDEEALELAIIENIQRDDLNPIEKAKGFRTLIDTYSMTQQDVADRLGISRTSVANLMRLLQLPEEVKNFVSRETLSMGHARCLLAVANPERQISLAKRITRDGLSVRETEGLVYGAKETPKKKKADTKRDPNIVALEKRFTEALATRVTIKNTKDNKGRITIEYYSNDDFMRIAELLGIKL
ncbi:ParB/RepB/Spo0J family partition protein [Planctomycetota bacterium]